MGIVSKQASTATALSYIGVVIGFVNVTLLMTQLFSKEEFGLREKGYAALVVVALGYSDPEKDYNAKLPKSRLPCSDILTLKSKC